MKQNAAQIFVFANQKGGVGKTTSAVNLAAALASKNYRVLLIDLDPQGNATMGSGIDKRTIKRSVYQVLVGLEDAASATHWSSPGHFSVLPANRDLAGAEIDLIPLPRRELRLQETIAEIQTLYDFILIDCPPALSLLTLNGLCCAQGVIIPMQCEYYALEGLSDLVNTIRRIRENPGLNPKLQVLGLLRVMFDTRVMLAQQVSEQIANHFGKKVFHTIIPRNVRLAEAPSHSVPGVLFDPRSKGARAYMDFSCEFILRTKIPLSDTPPSQKLPTTLSK